MSSLFLELTTSYIETSYYKNLGDSWRSGGYISIDNVGRLNKILHKAKRYGFTDSLLTFSELWEQSDEHWRRSLLGRAGTARPLFAPNGQAMFALPLFALLKF